MKAPARRGGVLPGFGALGLYLALAVAFCYRAWSDPTRLAIGGADDSWLATWFLRWFPYAISHGLNPLFSDHLRHPAGINLMWNTSTPFLAILGWPVMQVFGPVMTYNVICTLGIALSGLAVYVLVRRVVGPWLPALTAGCLYAFSPFMAGHSLGHPVLLWEVFPPLVFLLLYEAFVVQARNPLLLGALLGLLAGLQLLISAEVLVTTALVAAVGLAIIVVFHRAQVRARFRYAAKTLVAAAVVAVAAAAVPLGYAFFGPQRVEALGYAATLVNDPLGFVIPTQLQLVAPAFATELANRFPGNLSEWGAYIGIPVLVVVVVTGFIRRWDPLTRLLVILGLVIAVFSLGRRMHVLGNELPVPMPWAPLGRLPVLVDVVPNRMSIFVVLCAVVVVALFMERVMRAAPAMRAVGWAAIALVVISLVPVPPIASSGVAPAFFTSPSIQRIPEGSLVLVAPFATPTPRRIHDEAMLWQAIADMRFKMPEGYAIGPGPTDSPPDSATQREMIAIAEAPRAVAPPPASPATISQVAAEWRSWGVQFVVVGPMRNQDAMLALVRSAAGSQGTEVDGVWLWDLRGSGPG